MKDNISRKGFLKTGATALGSLLIASNLPGQNIKPVSSSDADEYFQGYTGTRWGSWVQTGTKQPGDISLQNCQIVIDRSESSIVQKAGRVLASDIKKISGYEPAVMEAPDESKVNIRLVTLGDIKLPDEIDINQLKDKWEAYQIKTTENTIWLVGADARGTAYAAYTLSERLGIDPLYIWTNYRPVQYDPLILKKTTHIIAPPKFKYRGFFHDDEDILPRPFNVIDLPIWTGDVATVWYERYFETALRLRMNMVAPYTRVHRRYEIQKMASDWGLYYTSHHYDILLSNPFGFENFKLAEQRGVTPQWDWFKNKENMIRYWQAGVEENKHLDAIWPVGLRGIDDRSYQFPKGMSDATKIAVYNEAINIQVQLVKKMIPKDKKPLFHFTLYTEMLDIYSKNKEAFNLPEDVMIIWPDDNDGHMRDLPKESGKWKHGVYYHLAYMGPQQITKQITHVVSPLKIAQEFKAIIDSGATEYVLTNVSELREYVMEARMLAEITWGDSGLIENADPGGAYINWWTKEYFGPEAYDAATKAYDIYYKLIHASDSLWQGSDLLQEILRKLQDKLKGKDVQPMAESQIQEFRDREKQYASFHKLIQKSAQSMNQQQQQYFYEQISLGMLVDWRPTQAALILAEALKKDSKDEIMAQVKKALEPLFIYEGEILKAERPPFEKWYRETWCRREFSPNNLHRPYRQVSEFYYSDGRDFTQSK
ncbi:glycosyl hydrolase 115 family protein [Mucilaginibacter panaciglaebae]|uniref:Beta-hexosaminidase bacterial type N-terminal domain-containing protein n=1 Tax=Mucilaginibacter panaciglaebae TaxID=502331 RepID=A0ABP7WWP8_9SPHI